MPSRRRIAPLALVGLSLVLPTPAVADPSDPSEVSAGDQYVEAVPGATGNEVTGVKHRLDAHKYPFDFENAQRISLKPSVVARLKRDGVASSRLLAQVAESPRFAAPRNVLPTTPREFTGGSRGFLAAATSALSSGRDGLGLLIVALAAISLVLAMLLGRLRHDADG